MRETFNILIATTGTCLSFLFGGFDLLVQVLTVTLILNYVSGITLSFTNKTLSAEIGLHKVLKKAMILIVLILAVMLDNLSNNGQWIFRSLVCYFYIANEGLSIIENLGGLGVPMPGALKEAMEKLKSKEDAV